jgi:hypothetical protein
MSNTTSYLLPMSKILPVISCLCQKYYQLSPAYVKYYQLSPAYVKYYQLSPAYVKYYQLSPAYVKYYQLSPAYVFLPSTVFTSCS